MKKLIKAICCVLCICILTICCGVIQNKQIIVQAQSEICEGVKSALLIDYNTNEVLYEKDCELRLPVASMVKLMTILLTIEHIQKNNIDLDYKIKTTENASSMGGSQVFIDAYEEYSIGELLKSVIISSANDSSVALAEYISGSEQLFVDLMNKRATELKMTNTLYANCTGLPCPEQYSCAIDCAKVLKEVIIYDIYHQYSKIWMQDFVHPSGRKTEMVNTNKLIRYYDGCDSGKTGSTSEAGYCLCASSKRKDLRLIAVVIGAKSGQERFKQTSLLFNYGFANFENKKIINKDECLQEFNFDKAKQSNVPVYPEQDYYALSKKGDENSIELSYSFTKTCAPIKNGEKVGTIIITKQGNVIGEIDIVVRQDIQKSSYLDDVKKIVECW